MHLASADSLLKGEILALTLRDVNFKSGTTSANKTLKRVQKNAILALDRIDILYQFPVTVDERGTVIF